MSIHVKPKHPSVLFIVNHDLAPQYGCYGGQAITPHVDELSNGGVRFDNHYCHWPLCGPSRANLFTGCRPLTTCRYDNKPFFPGFRNRVGTGFCSLPEYFRRFGYWTRGAGLIYHDVDDEPSWDVPVWRPPQRNSTATRYGDLPGQLVAEVNRDWVRDAAYRLIQQRWKSLRDSGLNESSLSDPNVARRAQGPAVEIAEGDDNIYYDGSVATKVAEMIEKAPKDHPFFIAGGFITGHLPFRAPKEYWDRYNRDLLELPAFCEPPAGSPDWVAGDSEPAQYYTTHGYEKPWRASPEQSRELLHGHLASMSYIDALIGRLISVLKSADRYDDTIIVVISDHGFHDGEHGYWGKHNLWDQSLRTPLIMRIPGVVPAVLKGLTAHVDVYPTLCELCSLPRPVFLEGESSVHLLRNPAGEGKEAVFSYRKHMWHDRIKAYDLARSVRNSRFRYTEYLDKSGRPIYRELFDYENDPEERLNQITNKSHENVVFHLHALLRSIEK